MDKSVLLIGRNPNVLANLAFALTDAGFSVKTTSLVEQASQDFDGTAIDLIAFGRGVDAATNTLLRTNFLAQNPTILFVDGLAPVIPLLVKQIKLSLADKPDTKKVITSFTVEQANPLSIHVFTAIDCPLTIDLYQLDTVHTTHQTTLVSESVNAGAHTFLVDDLPDTTVTSNFLVAEVADIDLAVLPLQ